MDTQDGYRLTLAALLGLVLSAITTGVFLEKHLLAATTKPDFAVIARAWNLIESNYVDRAAIRPERMTHAAIRGLVDSLGDTGHSAFLTPQMVRVDSEQMRGRFPGIGAEVQMRDKQVVIVAPLDGSPAQKAGLRAGDIVFRVDGRDVAGETLEHVVGSIRGPAGTTVVLSVRDPGSDRTRRVALERAVIHVQSV
ncbi:MAG: PDZ domain-containing protein, partial [Burkholderiales bacterium]